MQQEEKRRGVLARLWQWFLFFPLLGGELREMPEDVRVRVARQKWAFVFLVLSAGCASFLFAATPNLRFAFRGLPGLPLGLNPDQTKLLSELLQDSPWLQLLILPYGLAVVFSGYARWTALGAWNESDVERKQWFSRLGTMLTFAITIAIYVTAMSRTLQFHGWVSVLPALAALSLLLCHLATPWQDLKSHAAGYRKSLRGRIAEYRQGCVLLSAYVSSYSLGVDQDRIRQVQSQLEADIYMWVEGPGRDTPEDVPVLEILEKDWAPLEGALGLLPLLARGEGTQELALARKLVKEIETFGSTEEQGRARDLAQRLTSYGGALAADAASGVVQALNVVQARERIKDALADLANLFRASVLVRPKVLLERLKELCQRLESQTRLSFREAVPEELRSRVESLARAMPDRPQPNELEPLVEEARSVYKQVSGLFVPRLRQIVDESRSRCQRLQGNLELAHQLLGRSPGFEDVVKSQQEIAAGARELTEMQKTLGRDTLSEASVTQLVERLHDLVADLSDAEALLSHRVKEEEDKVKETVGIYGGFEAAATPLGLDGRDGELFRQWLERRHRMRWGAVARQVLVHTVGDPDVAGLLTQEVEHVT